MFTVQAGPGPRTPMAYQSLAAPQSRSEKESPDLPPHQQMGVLTFIEKKFLLAVERGDVASSRRLVSFHYIWQGEGLGKIIVIFHSVIHLSKKGGRKSGVKP